MAKVENPLLSFSASGKYKNSIIFQTTKSFSYVLSMPKYSRNRKINPSLKQLQTREYFILAKLFYKFATLSEKNYLYGDNAKNYNNENAEIMGIIMKKKPTYNGLSFLGDNTIGSVTN